MWPVLWALAIAGGGQPSLWVLLVFVLGVVLMRSAGCAINDFADRKLDGHVARTCNRPLATGELRATDAVVVFVLIALLAFALVLTLNSLTIWLSFGGLALAFSYPFMKRYHHLPQVHLGAAFAWSVPMAFAAEMGEIPRLAWLLYVATLLWTTAYDTMYGMVDREDDLKIGVKSTAILFGDMDKAMIAVLQALFLLSLFLVGRELQYDQWFFYGLGVAAALSAYEHLMLWYRLPEYCFKAFLHNHWVGAAIFFAIQSQYLF